MNVNVKKKKLRNIDYESLFGRRRRSMMFFKIQIINLATHLRVKNTKRKVKVVGK